MTLSQFDENAINIAQRQYFQEGENIEDMFRRVAKHVAKAESEDKQAEYEEKFYQLMINKKFCPGGRVLAGAGTQHGNVLNCFVQDGSPEEEGTNEWVLNLARKLALVSRVGGGNGLCLDSIGEKREFTGNVGNLYIICGHHPNREDVKTGTFTNLVVGKSETRGYRYATFIDDTARLDPRPNAVQYIRVEDSIESIWECAQIMVFELLDRRDVVVDVTSLRPEGSPVKGSGGNSSGPASFAVEIFDNFGYWASLGGADYAGASCYT